MTSAFGVICGLAAAAMLACGIRAEAKHKAQQRQRDDAAEAGEEDFGQWDAEWADWRGAP